MLTVEAPVAWSNHGNEISAWDKPLLKCASTEGEATTKLKKQLGRVYFPISNLSVSFLPLFFIFGTETY